MGRWDHYLGKDRPLPMGEQSLREYHSGDPEPEAHCVDCGAALYEGDYVQIGDECYCTACDASEARTSEHSLATCPCATCDEDRAELGWVRS